MNLSVPNLESLELEELHLCAFFEGDESWLSHWSEHPVRMQSSYGDGTGIRLAIDAEPEGEDAHGHIHFDIARRSEFEGLKEFDQAPLDELVQQLDRLNGHGVFLMSGAECRVELDQLPPRGMIRTILGISTESCGSQLALQGAEMSIDGDLFSRLVWKFNDRKQVVTAELYAETETEIVEDYIVRAAELMRHGIECFVLETEDRWFQHVQQANEARKTQA